ncbi:MAG: hypothetical protein J6T10_22250 [Methanobrevibacter sp.]|nr:hypothetical protein [Methanobrevibacter sp.]
MGNLIKFLYVKWILHYCPHCCACCRYRKEMFSYCMDEFLEEARKDKLKRL